jgi:hypothetical protein
MLLRDAVGLTLESAREAQDLLLAYLFRAARAFDLYTLAETPRAEGIRYDYGHVHPDLVAQWRAGLATDVALVRALEAVTPSPTDLLTSITLYDEYRRTLDSDAPYTFVFTQQSHPDVIHRFKATGQLDLPLTLADLRPNRSEVKVTGVRIRLTGITTPNSATFSCIVGHDGISQQRRWSTGDVVTTILRPSTDSIELPLVGPSVYQGAFIVPDHFTGEIKLRCFGRGIAAGWTIRIDATTGPVDLTNLSEIRIEIENDAKLGTGARRVIDMPGVLTVGEGG